MLGMYWRPRLRIGLRIICEALPDPTGRCCSLPLFSNPKGSSKGACSATTDRNHECLPQMTLRALGIRVTKSSE